MDFNNGTLKIETFYLSEEGSLKKTVDCTGLSLDEIEYVVGRFSKNSSRAGKLKGEVVQKLDGTVIIRHHFTKKTLWTND